MSITTDIILFLIMILVILAGLLYREHHYRMEQDDYFFRLNKITGLFLFNYDVKKDCMYLSAACAKMLHLPETIPNFHNAAERFSDPSEHLGLGFLNRSIKRSEKPIILSITGKGTHQRFYRVTSRHFYQGNGKNSWQITGFFYDVTSNTVKERKLELKASTDHLTGIYNRGTLYDLISSILTSTESGAFIMLDIDHFKAINDTVGHQAGDDVLRNIARILRQQIRHTDIMGRMGGDEFCIFLRNVPSQEFAQKLCNRICHAVSANISYGKNKKPVTMSIGGTLSQPGDTFTSLYGRADKALYQSKHQGRNRATMDNNKINV